MKRPAGGRTRIILAALLGLATISSFAQPGTLDMNFSPGSGANSNVLAVALQSDGKIIIGGLFNSYKGVARLNQDGSPDDSFDVGWGAEVDYLDYGTPKVTLLKVQSDDRIIVGGTFTLFNGTNRNKVARLEADGSLDLSYNPNPVDTLDVVSSPLAVQSDGKLLQLNMSGNTFSIYRRDLSGQYDDSFVPWPYANSGGGTVNPITSVFAAMDNDGKMLVVQTYSRGGTDYLSRLQVNGSSDSGFGLMGSIVMGNAGGVFAFQNDRKMLFGGSFTTFSGVLRNHLVRLESNGSVDPTFDPSTGPNLAPLALALQPDGKILVAGNFTSFNGVARSRIARLNPDGSLDMTFDPGSGPNGQINALAIERDGEILIAGQFTSVNGQPRNGIARLNGDVASAPAFVIAPSSQSAIAGRRLLLSTTVSGGQPLTYQWRFNGANMDGETNAVLGFAGVPLASAGQYTVEVSNAIESITSTEAELTVLRAPVISGSVDIAYTPGADGPIRAMVMQTNGQVVIAGLFKRINGVVRNHVARLNADGTLDGGFDPGLGPNSPVFALAVQDDGKVLIGGAFTNVSAAVRLGIARLKPDGSLDTSFNPAPITAVSGTASVYAIAVQPDGKVCVGGSFYRVAGVSHPALARLTTTGAFDSGLNASLSGSVYSLLLDINGDLLAGGANPGTFLIRCRTNGWNSSYSFPSVSGPVRTIALQQDGKILIGGSFVTLSYGLIRLNSDGSQDTSLVSQPTQGNANVVSVQPDGKILAAGYFTALNGSVIIRLSADGTLDSSYSSHVTDGTIYAMALLTGGKVLFGGDFASVDGCVRYGIARANGDVRILAGNYLEPQFDAAVQTDPDKIYTLEFKDSLSGGNWISFPTVGGDGTVKTLSDPAVTGSHRFYRIRVE